MQNNIEKLPHDRLCKNKLHKLVDILLRRIPGIDSIVLFGSYARFEQKITSDIDMLVLTKEEICRELKGELCSVFDEMHADLVFYSVVTFHYSDSLLVKQIREDGVLLWES